MIQKFEYEYSPQMHSGLNGCTSQLHSSTRHNRGTNGKLTGIIYKVGTKRGDGNSLKFQLKGTAMWQRELLSYKTCKRTAHQNFLPPSTGFHYPQEKYRLISNNTTVLILERYRYRKAKHVSAKGHNNK